MSALQNFVRDQLGKAQAQLEKLLLLHTQEKREDLNVRFWIHRVVDNDQILRTKALDQIVELKSRK
jgi:hypothetical protein